MQPFPAYDADVMILGAGCAGMALAARLAASAPQVRAIAVDPRTRYDDDRSWCFWGDEPAGLEGLTARAWSDWVYQAEAGAAHPHRVDGVAYRYVRAADYYAHCRARIAASEHVELRLGIAAGAVRRDGEALVVSTTAGELRARWVVDTRPRRQRALLFQCFSGVEVDHGGRLDLAALGIGPDAVGLMTGMRADASGLGFVYVLPLSRSTALVEWTRFAPRPLRAAEVRAGRDASLAALGVRLGEPGGRVLREEGGVLPMGRVADDALAPSIPGLVVAGAAGGALRDATGYGFARMQQWADDCAARLARGEAPVGHPPEPFVRRQMDRIFLQALRAHPERSAEYFERMARGVAPERLLRFLTDRARPADLLAIIASLPLLPFLAQLPDRSRRHAEPLGRRRGDLVGLGARLTRPRPARAAAAKSEPETLEQVAS